MTTETETEPRISFETHPDRYHHWKLEIDGAVATLKMAVQEDHPLRPGYELKLNSYDLGVDIELQDSIQRLRFEHPEVRSVIVTGGFDRIFCAGANIHMLGSSTHAFKVNFCKFTNETRLSIEDAEANSGQRFLAALNGTCAGGGYELALACGDIVLIDDGNSAVSLPEVPLLGVLPGTGGLTRLVDKRKVRRDLADVFCTTAEGVKGKRAVEWGLIDATVPRSKFDEFVQARAEELAGSSPARSDSGIELTPLDKTIEDDRLIYSTLEVNLDRESRVARIEIKGPDQTAPADAAAAKELGASWWLFRLFREFDDALCDLRANEASIGLVLIQSQGSLEDVLAHDAILENAGDDWFLDEVRLFIARTLRRMDLTARSLFTLIEPGSCFGGTLFELSLASDRTYMLDDPDRPVAVALNRMNAGAYPMSHGPTRMVVRFLGKPQQAEKLLAKSRSYDAADTEEAELVTVVADDIDYEDEVRLAIEERSSLSPDSLTGMEASLRFPGSENCDSKIFGRLSAWQNWIFQRPNAVGKQGALTLYGRPDRPTFDFRRT
ncbi:MAG: 2,3-epoxybenzoyl-CoA dihydrolase [Acidobacteriota bacterium]|nr:2,3-epoxybenzoyl-CoA dihydrolase [Acidobacteriota bacterium]